jgi:hypothetical protein
LRVTAVVRSLPTHSNRVNPASIRVKQFGRFFYVIRPSELDRAFRTALFR